MIDVDKIEVGDKLRVDCPYLLAAYVHPIVTVVESDDETYQNGFWIHKDKVLKGELDEGDDKLTLVATNTKYSDISEGDVVEVACLSDKQIEHWPDIEKLIGKQGEVVHKSKSVHVGFELGGQLLSEWCLEAENLRVVKKGDALSKAVRPIGSIGYYPTLSSQGDSVDEVGVTASALDKQVSGSHYKSCAIQPIEYIHANGLDYFQGNVVKYVTRHKDKNGKADIEKAIHYLELILELQYKDE